MTSRRSSSTADRTVTDDDAGDRKKQKKKASTSDRVLSVRNDEPMKTDLSVAVKRKSKQMMTATQSADYEDTSECSQPKKPSPTNTVSIQCNLMARVNLFDLVTYTVCEKNVATLFSTIDNSRISWWIIIILIPLETGMNTP